ncbi:tyrosine-type recombinase/integrase [Actinophytocola xanthii]|uniref:Integrase n=1 Tax=Actinophytocola xanthii TaxID=1912961 RepID=A0A1Q8CBW3_9PSEU|nr:tyrosine-type recombinase/integrase [Actinophytocola xanthii]OLF11877.1 integrase [Actinophytocola xanthii]
MTGDLTEEGLPRPVQPVWRGYVQEWDRALRAAGKPLTTRYNYELAVTQCAEFLGSGEVARFVAASGVEVAEDMSDAAEDPTDVQRSHVEWFIAWMIETRSASTALNKYKALQQFFGYLEDEEEITRHPMRRMSQPTKTKKLVPVLGDEEIAAVLATCSGKSFLDRRDTAVIRLLLDTGGRLTETTMVDVDDVNLRRDLLKVRGKGDKERAIPFGEKTGQAITRYLRVRAKHPGAGLPALFLAERGRKRLGSDGVKTMLRRRGEAAGIGRLHAHRFRHTLAHEWRLNGGDADDLMAIMGWESREMLRVYGESAAAVRAEATHRRLGLGNRV